MSAWPSAEQFDAAHALGTTKAQAEIADGATNGREAPLSGEWAGDITLDEISRAVGFTATDIFNDELSDALDELGNAWERGYHDVWSHHTPQESEWDKAITKIFPDGVTL